MVTKKNIIAVIGSRKMSDYGRRVVGEMIPEMIKRGWEIMTANVTGINAEVINKGKGKVIIVQGENLYEINHKLAEKCDRLLIIEGGEKSGTVLVAKEVLDLGKEVWVVPGRLGDEGSKVGLFLIRNGAKVFTEIEDLE